jgi:hypothetical protein
MTYPYFMWQYMKIGIITEHIIMDTDYQNITDSDCIKHRLNFMAAQNLYVEILTQKIVVLECEIFDKLLGHRVAFS